MESINNNYILSVTNTTLGKLFETAGTRIAHSLPKVSLPAA
jgi:hypothetical protein